MISVGYESTSDLIIKNHSAVAFYHWSYNKVSRYTPCLNSNPPLSHYFKTWEKVQHRELALRNTPSNLKTPNGPQYYSVTQPPSQISLKACTGQCYKIFTQKAKCINTFWLLKHDTLVMAMANRILFLMGYVPLRSVKPTTAPIITGQRVNSDIITSRSWRCSASCCLRYL